MFNKCVCTEIIGVFEFSRSEKGIFHTEKRDFCSISMRKSGSTDFDGVTVKPYEIIFIPSGISYSQVTAGYEEVICAHFSLSGEFERRISVLSGNHSEMISRLLSAWKSGNFTLSMSLLYGILAEFDLKPISLADKAKNYADENIFSAELTVSEIAKASGVSVQYLRREYRKKYGTTLSDYIISRRLAAARECLFSGYYTVAETAEKCGFSDAKYFSRAFCKKYGVPPSKVKKQ